MLTIDYDRITGWGKPQILPYGNLSIPVSATSLHYGISCYEGINIVKNKESAKSQAFRADKVLMQFLDTTNHLDLPLFDHNELLLSIKELVKIDKEWFPTNLDNPG
jgi:branched-chain amino acid aminotransferase